MGSAHSSGDRDGAGRRYSTPDSHRCSHLRQSGQLAARAPSRLPQGCPDSPSPHRRWDRPRILPPLPGICDDGEFQLQCAPPRCFSLAHSLYHCDRVSDFSIALHPLVCQSRYVSLVAVRQLTIFPLSVTNLHHDRKNHVASSPSLAAAEAPAALWGGDRLTERPIHPHSG